MIRLVSPTALLAMGLVQACGAPANSSASNADTSTGTQSSTGTGTGTSTASGGAINTLPTGLSLTDACNHYKNDYPVTGTGPWTTGIDIASCAPGTMTANALTNQQARLNWYRAFYPLPPVPDPDPTMNAKAQACALMTAANQQENHFPPTTWTCYTADGAAAASTSVIAAPSLTIPGPPTPAGPVDEWLYDNGNVTTLGHRRWVLYPGQKAVGYGFVDQGPSNAFNGGACMITVDSSSDTGAGANYEQPVPYPPPGTVPLAPFLSQSSYLAGLPGADQPDWSLTWRNADFSKATLTMTDVKSGQPISLKENLTTMAAGYGDNTAAWHPAVIPADGDQWNVSISGITISGVAQGVMTYQVNFSACQ